jgi:hypothetical protein
MDRLELLKSMLDKGDLPETPRVRWRKMPQRNPRRKNEPYPEHSLSQLRDDPVENPY